MLTLLRRTLPVCSNVNPVAKCAAINREFFIAIQRPFIPTTSITLERAAAAQQRDCVSLWAVVEKGSGEIVGACGFHFTAAGPELELACHFRPSHWGRGFATEAACACVLYASETLGATRTIAGVEVGNSASRRVLEKSGFRLERLERGGDVDEEWFSIPLSAT